jgi:23S rRNA pseudouridine2604 synthase
MTEPVRLAKHLAAMVPCSRREAELYIAGGWVRVDGEVVEEPQFKLTTQTVELDPEAELSAALPASMVFNKPAGVVADAGSGALLVTPDTRSRDDVSGVRLLKRHFQHLEAPVPLETEAGGFVLYTQDRRLAAKLKEDGDRFEHEYVVEVGGQAGPEVLARMQQGVGIGARPPTAIRVSWQSEARLRIALKAVQPGHIRQLCEAAGLEVRAIRRLRIGRIPLARLGPGEWRYLGVHERF